MDSSVDEKVAGELVAKEAERKSEKESQRAAPSLFNLSSQRLYGRDKEEAQLLYAYQQAMTSPNCELVLISGLSGTGKSTLAHNTLRKQQEAHVICGKFEERKQPPFSVFVQALTEYVERIIDTHPEQVPLLKKNIGDMVTEGGLLTHLIPSLAKIMGPQPPTTSQDVSSQAARFKYIFSRLIQALASVHPLVILLDDVTWADDASLEMIDAVLLLQEKDKPLPLLVVGTHRPLDETCSLLKLIKHLDSELVTDIALCDWNVDMVNHFLSDTLQRAPSDTVALAQLIHSQTQGNIFHVLQYLRLLDEQGLLYFDVDRGMWQWDLNELESKPASELLHDKLQQLPNEVRETLEAAACMGDIVDKTALLTVFDKDENQVASSLDQAVQAGFLVESQDKGYRFAHDRIRQTISTLSEQPDQFQLGLGRKLWDTVTDDNLFMVVTLLNRGSSLIRHKHERYRLAELNLRAGLKAASLSSFLDAAFYLNSGIDLLGRDHWKEDYRLSLELFDTAAEVEMVNAHFERVRELITQVLEHAATLQDKMRSYTTLMRSVGQQDDMEEALVIGFHVLKSLGYPLPRNASKWTMTKEFVRTKWMLRNMTIQDYCSLPLMTNKNTICCSDMLNLLSIYAVLSRSPFVPIIALRTIQLCIRYGLSHGSSWAFAFYGMTFIARGDFPEGERMAEVSLAVLEVSGAHEMLPRVYAIVYSGLYHWKRPLRETLEPLRLASRVGLEVGDVEHSMLCVNRYVVHCYFAGHPLSSLEEDFVEYARQMKAYKQVNCLISFNLIGQLIHNLTGRAEDPSVLKGEIMDIDVALAETEATHSAVFQSSCVQYSAYVAYLFGDYDKAFNLEESLAHGKGFTNCFWGKVQACLFRGLSAIALALKYPTRRKRCLRIGKDCFLEMSTWASHCPSNFRHKQKLLEAELLGTDQGADSTAVLALYDEAIECAGLEGVIHEEALCCERATEYLKRIGDSAAADDYRDRASYLYLEWGATAKAAATLLVTEATADRD